MLRTSRGMTLGGLYEHDSAATWVWSDLHLGHTKTIEVFRRPFGTAHEMNDTIFRNWEQVVAPADTILILGDVTVHGLWGRQRGTNGVRAGATRERAAAVEGTDDDQHVTHPEQVPCAAPSRADGERHHRSPWSHRTAFVAVWWSTPKN